MPDDEREPDYLSLRELTRRLLALEAALRIHPPVEGGAGTGTGEPMPDPLKEILDNIAADPKTDPDLRARLVGPDPDEEARKAALMQRLIDLEGLNRLGAMGEAAWREYGMLTTYASWFK